MQKHIYKWFIGVCMACPYVICNATQAASIDNNSAKTAHKTSIRMNQLGFYPKSPKCAIIESTLTLHNVFVTNEDGDTILCAPLQRTPSSPWSEKQRYAADLTSIQNIGIYTLHSANETASFSIRNDLYKDLSHEALKVFYLMRSGIPIEKEFAGKYSRQSGHPDTSVYIHPSAASPQRPANTIISSAGGWYDAGDYNKYIVNASFSIGMMLSVYEQIPHYFNSLSVQIPESHNQTADIIDEVLFNLKWMFSMQDPHDGGVYHKLTTPNFEGFVMPHECKQKRYVVAKSTTATLDFAAVMAQAARILRHSPDYPTFSAQAEEAAQKAYEWAIKNPKAYYRQSHNNQHFAPAIQTGEYGDGNAQDEFFWAATQLYLLTGSEFYLQQAEKYTPSHFTPPTWGNVSALGTFGWLNSKNKKWKSSQTQLLQTFVNRYLEQSKESSFQAPFGNEYSDYGWGCLAEKCCAPSIALLFANPTKYLPEVISNADCLLGRNATGYSYVTGFGQKTPMHPHHRISEADDIQAPFPGMLVGGPNPGRQDEQSGNLHYPSTLPDESYIDEVASYASNEIAINWNASFVAFICWLDALMTKTNL